MKRRTIISVLVAVIISSGTFLLLGILLLPAKLQPSPAPAGDSVSGVDYYSNNQNASVLCLYENGSGALLYLDFDSSELKLLIYNDHAMGQALKSGYDVNYTVNLTADFLCRFCDRIGGITLGEGDAERRYLSAGLRQKLSEKADYNEREKITTAFFEKIAKIGLSSDDFMFIIEETDNNLAYPVCYGWLPHISELAQNCIFLKD